MEKERPKSASTEEEEEVEDEEDEDEDESSDDDDDSDRLVVVVEPVPHLFKGVDGTSAKMGWDRLLEDDFSVSRKAGFTWGMVF